MPAFLKFILRRRTSRPVNKTDRVFFIAEQYKQAKGYGTSRNFVLRTK